jgi:hypothetical protein
MSGTSSDTTPSGGQKNTPGRSDIPGPSGIPGSTNSWSSKRVTETVRLIRLQNMAKHLGLLQSPFFPKDLLEYTRHLQAIQRNKMDIAQDQIRVRILEMRARDDRGDPIKLGVFLNGKTLDFKRLDVAGRKQEKVWPFGTPKPDPHERILTWPSTVEAKFEGERRAKKGLDRRLPVPRRKVDKATAARLLNAGVPLGVTAIMMAAHEEVVGLMLQDALARFCGLDESAWRQMELERIQAERQERGTRSMARQGPVQRRDPARPASPEEIRFDEVALLRYGMWEEILYEVNKPCV